MNILVIGGGPAGYVAAIRSAQLGANVTLIEREQLGGTCLNVGCIPTKALLQTSELYEQSKNSGIYGISNSVSLDFTVAQNRKASVVKQLVNGVKSLLKANGVNVIFGTASFIDSHTVLIKKDNNESQIIKSDKIIIAVGSKPSTPFIPGVEGSCCIDSTGALSLTEVPESMVIIGGGVIGIEMAEIYVKLGTKVTIIELQNEILPTIDQEISRLARKVLTQKGVEIYTGSKVVSISSTGTNAEVLVEVNDEQRSFIGEKVLVSIGRKAATETLELEKAGIENERGKIKVNEYMETNVPGIFAAGDCNGGIMLAHIAFVEGEIAAENALGLSTSYNGKTNPSCVYISPEIASVGLTEEQVKSQGIEYEVGKFPLAANGKSLIMGEKEGFIKIIAGKSYKEILGVHIIGTRATDMIAECSLAIGLEATVDDIISIIHGHPTISESIREAAMNVEKRSIHFIN